MAQALVVISILLVVGFGLPAVAGNPRNTMLTVIDGDTLDLNGQVIELAGIDAPELGQYCLDGDTLYACGLDAAFELHKILTLESVNCRPVNAEADRYDCMTSANSLSVLLAEDGLAVATDRSGPQLAEEKARRIPLGIWRGKFVVPGNWRDGERLAEERSRSQDCPVLGIELQGAPVYLTPTDADYNRWRERTDAIKQRFCCDEDARAQGYTHYRVGAALSGDPISTP